MAQKEKWRRDEKIKKGKHQRRVANPCSAAKRDLSEEGVDNHGDLL